MSMTGPWMIVYGANPTMCLGAKDQMAGAQLNLIPRNSSAQMTLWSIDNTSNQICLYSAGNMLAIDIGGAIANQTPLTLNLSNANSTTQKWDYQSNPKFIMSRANSQFCIDDQNRQQQGGTLVWLYQFNASPAQQWLLVPLNQLAAFDQAHAASAAAAPALV